MRESSAGVDATQSRLRGFTELEERVLDVAVVGGGINGAAIALQCAARGLDTALFEKNDFAYGTSSRSSRLIHGGVRYLEYAQLPLVFEASRERRILRRLAPHLVRPQSFIWPVYEGARLPLWKVRTGLWLYDLLSLFRNFGRHQTLNREEVMKSEPGLRKEGLIGGVRYYDARTDDSRLTIANIRSAHSSGATVLNYCAVASISADAAGGTVGVVDRISGTALACRARVIVNATGPWSDEVLALLDAASEPQVHSSKGVHVSFNAARAHTSEALTMLSPRDGRVLFLLPSGATAIAGTTETEAAGSPDEVRASQDDIDYLLEAVNHYLPAAGLTRDDVMSAWAGIRPLARSHFSGTAGSTSREHSLRWSSGAVLSVTGGKLTTYRVVAADAARMICRQLMRSARPRPAAEALPGAQISSMESEIGNAAAATGDVGVARMLVSSYGSEWKQVWALAAAHPHLSQQIHGEHQALGAQVLFAIREEMAQRVSDILFRRTHVAFETRDHGLEAAAPVAELMRAELGWNDQKAAREVQQYRSDIEQFFGRTQAPAPPPCN